MCGICFSIDANQQLALNELINSNLQSVSQLDLLVESVDSTGLIPDTSYEWIKKSIEKNDQHGLIHMLGSDNRERLFELALIKTNMWGNRKFLTVFIKPHAFNMDLNKLIELYSNTWTPFSGIEFRFVNSLPAQIIVELNANSVHSSLIGRNSLLNSNRGLTTMKLGIGVTTEEDKIRRPILHEFGHALGCKHEHQSPASSIKWNTLAVYRYFALGGWDANMVQNNIFNQYSSGEVTNSKFDPSSIMIYPIDISLTLDGFFVNWNTHLSTQDKAFIKKAYSIK
jgi:serralysin